MTVRSVLYAAHHRPDTVAYRWAQGIIWACIGLSVAFMVIEVLVELPAAVHVWFERIDAAILVVFSLDLVLQVATYRPPELALFRGSAAWRLRTNLIGRLRYLFSPMVLVDIITVLSLVPALRGLRALRLLRLLVGIRFFRYANPIRNLLRSFAENSLLYQGTLGLLLSVVVIAGASLYFLEAGQNDHVQSIGDGMWWALVTITTVGFGDITPVTVGGRIIAGVVMVFGMFTLALFAGIVSTTILHVMFRLREEQFRMSTHVNHVIVCGYDGGSRMLLDAIQEEAYANERELILFAPGERPENVPAAFTWIRGDPTKESELDKVKLEFADSVIVVGSRQHSIQEADATTILTLFTLRSYVAKQKVNEKRDRPIYVVAEILDHENVEHAYTSGANEVIETTRLGFSLMAHAVQAHGSGSVMGSVASAGAASIYVGRSPYREVMPYGAVARGIKTSYGVTVLGLRDREGAVVLGPDDDADVPPDRDIVYLASRPVLEPT